MRWLCVLSLGLIALAQQEAFAAAPKTYYRHSTVGTWKPDSQYYPTKEMACMTGSGALAGIKYSDPWQFSGGGSVDGSLNCHLNVRNAQTGQGGTYNVGSAYSTAPRCDPGGTLPDTSKPLNEQCPDKCQKGQRSNISVITGWRTGPEAGAAYAKEYDSPVGGSICTTGCIANFVDVSACAVLQSPEGGYYREQCDFVVEKSGSECSGQQDPNEGKAPPTEPPPEKNRCPLGTKQTGIDSDGIPICTGDPKPPPETKTTNTTKTTNPDGSVTETTTETTTNSDGSTTTKTTTRTTGTDGTVTQSENTSTGNRPDGKPGTQNSTDKDRQDLCKMNPTLTICRNSQVSGACENVSCEGDAIQCAMYRQMQKQYCEDRADSAIKTLGEQILNGNDPQAGTLPTRANAEQIPLASLDQAGFLGGGSCFKDKQISVMGKAVTIPFSAACEYLVAFRYVIMVIALLVSFRLLGGVILRS